MSESTRLPHRRRRSDAPPRPALREAAARHEPAPECDVVTSEVPVAAMLEAARVMNDPSPPADLGLESALAKNASGSEPPRSEPPRSAPPLAAEYGLEELIDAKPSARFPSRAHGLWIALGAAVLGLASLFLLRSWNARQARAEVEAPVQSGAALRSTVGSAPSALPVPVLGCSMDHAPVKLDDWAVAEVRPSLVALPHAGKALLGYAQSHRQAVGGELDVTSLRHSRSFGHNDDAQIFSVTALAAGTPGFHVERMGGLWAFGRALDTEPALGIGMQDSAVVLGRLDQRLEKIWDLPPATLISVPEVAAHEGGFTVALRTGRNLGQLRMGLLGEKGAPVSGLEIVGSPEADYSRPALASGREQTVVAVSERLSPERGHVLMLGRAPAGRLPAALEPLDLPGASGIELSAPALTALADGGFAVMWSQGTGPARQARVQRLSSTLMPLGDPLVVADPGPDSGGAVAGALYTVGDRVLAFHFVRREDGHSLWVARLGCGS